MSSLHNEGNVKPDAKVLEYMDEVHDGDGKGDGESRRLEY